jgi:hypothetical protein
MTNTANTAALADAYAQLQAEKKALDKRFEVIKNQVIACGEGELVGEYYTVIYKKTAPVKTFDKDLATGKLAEFGLSAAQIDEVFASVKIGKGRDIITVEASAISFAAE